MTKVSEPRAQKADGPSHRAGRSRRAPLFVAAAAVTAIVVAVLAFGVFGVQSLFIDDEVAEAGPQFESGASLPESDTSGAPSTDADGPVGSSTTTGAGEDPTTTTTPPDDAAPTTAPAAPTTAPTVEVAGTGTFEAGDHSGSGEVNLLTDGRQTFVRFEDDFATENGPDLYAVVFVAGERVELGQLKGNQGAQNYEVPTNIDPASIETVEVWCKRFDSTFTSAAITAT